MHVLTVICRDGWMSGNLSEGWRRLGCTVEEFFYGSQMGKAWDAGGLETNRRTNLQLLEVAERKAAEGRLDLIFCVIYDDVLEVATIQRLRRLGVPVVNYHVDLVGQWYRILRTGRYFDRVACAHEEHWPGLRRADIRPYYLPMAANPPLAQEPFEPSLAFDGAVYLGSPWEYRRDVLAQLARDGFPLRIYGNNWHASPAASSHARPWRKDFHDLRHYFAPRVREEGPGEVAGSLMPRLKCLVPSAVRNTTIPETAVQGRYADRDFAGIVRGAAVNLGFTHFRGAPGTAAERRQVRLREFEIPMRGGFYLTQNCRQLTDLYTPGYHLDTWDDRRELSEKLRHYLDRPADRDAIARLGQAHALEHHTWESRFRALLDDLSVPPPVTTTANPVPADCLL